MVYKRFHLTVNAEMQKMIELLKQKMAMDNYSAVIKLAILSLYEDKFKHSPFELENKKSEVQEKLQKKAFREKIKLANMTPTQAMRNVADAGDYCRNILSGQVVRGSDGGYLCALPPHGVERWQMPEDYIPSESVQDDWLEEQI